jgi:hypothetical protein
MNSLKLTMSRNLGEFLKTPGPPKKLVFRRDCSFQKEKKEGTSYGPIFSLQVVVVR